MSQEKLPSVNVMGGPLGICSVAPMTGYFRNGLCDTCTSDTGSHTVCAIMTDEFLAYSKYLGNDLSTPRPEFGFKGLKAGDKWCLCAGRFAQTVAEGVAPHIDLNATHQRALEVVSLETLTAHVKPA
jgi:uncharacterized protein (DUF2237 family)